VEGHGHRCFSPEPEPDAGRSVGEWAPLSCIAGSSGGVTKGWLLAVLLMELDLPRPNTARRSNEL
jgi:hypothetical protein